jgi:integrase
MKATINERLIGKFGGRDLTVFDTTQPNLMLRLRATGAHSYRVAVGRGKFLTLGTTKVLKPMKARELARRALGKVADGRDPIAESRKKRAGTLEEFLDRQYDEWARANLKTADQTSVRARAVFADFLTKPMPEITAFSVERWRSQRHRDGIAPATTNRDLDCLRSVLSKAVEWGVLAEHPLKKMKRAKLDAIGRLRYLSADEETRLRAALTKREQQHRDGRASFNAWRLARHYKPIPDYAPGAYVDHLQALVLTALLTGARRGELFDLRWGAVDLARPEVTFAGATTKSGLSRRVPLCNEAQRVLRAWRDQQAPKAQEPDALVFPSPQTGERLDNVGTAWGGLVKAARLKDFTFHSLRHSFASTLAQRGVDLYVIQRLLGHASPIMTQRYSHLADEHLTAAVAKLAAR